MARLLPKLLNYPLRSGRVRLDATPDGSRPRRSAAAFVDQEAAVAAWRSLRTGQCLPVGVGPSGRGSSHEWIDQPERGEGQVFDAHEPRSRDDRSLRSSSQYE